MSDVATAVAPASGAATSPADETLYEVVDGLVVEKPPMGSYEGCVGSLLLRLMCAWDSANTMGRVLSEMLFVLDPASKLKRRPDLAYLSYDRWPRRSPIPAGDAWDVIPDPAVEVNSPSNRANEVMRKVEEYFRSGVREVWVVYPVLKRVYVYSSPTAVRILKPGDDLDGGDVLPGFRVAVSAVFEDEVVDA